MAQDKSMLPDMMLPKVPAEAPKTKRPNNPVVDWSRIPKLEGIH